MAISEVRVGYLMEINTMQIVKRVVSLLVMSLFFSNGAIASDNPFQTEFNYSQQAHPRAKGRLGEGYRIQSYFRFSIPKTKEGIDWVTLEQDYFEQVRPGLIHLSEASQLKQVTKAKTVFPCDIQYIFSKAKEVEQRGAKEGFDNLSNPERAIYNFSKRYIRDQRAITFNRALITSNSTGWKAIIAHYGYVGEPIKVLEERLTDFNQFVIDGSVQFVVTESSATDYEVLGQIVLSLEADVLDQRVVGLFLSLPVKASLKGLLPTKIVFKRVAEKMKLADSGEAFVCDQKQSGEASLVYGVPNFANSYLKSLQRYLSKKL